ncbi:5-formyltetrahydrofolate cyclo-ligase [Brevibacillus fulvus]|uniref:5-formyltetrahydrofolate cyclo-ligase n=1 Tax=Brevibacillus fulvus TaxID=1125967 RepID=A0A939BW93_9BACL|nr:5-formyltetrahydrofolate cyclo-ligase [Brevibacillus fulvus]MBM7591571.1 5-formyltetrahydrofolate cyclo-ligase [Brevibacillus fulvus]
MDRVEAKAELRKQKLAELSSLLPDERACASSLAAERLLALKPLAACRTIMLFYPFRQEIDTLPFIERAMQRGQTVWLPVTDPTAKKMVPYVYQGASALRRGAYGIYEPDPVLCPAANLVELEAVVLPGVAFDQAGARLGYGGGYYDRFIAGLQRKPLLIGYGYSLQVVKRVPREVHDVALDYVVTDSRTWGPFAGG